MPAPSPDQRLTAAAYQQLIKSALRTNQLTAIPRILHAVAQDGELHHDDALFLLQHGAALAARSPSPLGPLPGLPPRRALLVFQPWFGFLFPRLVRDAAARGFHLALFSAARLPAERALADLSPANCRTYRHTDIPLWELAQYQLAIRLRTLPAAIDPADPAAWREIQTTFAEAAGLIDEGRAFLQFYQPESVLYAQGYDLIAAAMRHLCVPAGIRVVAVENTLRRDRLAWEDLTGIAVNRNFAKNYFWRFIDFIPSPTAEATATRYFGAIQDYKLAEHASAPGLPPPAPAGQPTLLYLGQVGTDAAVLFGRRAFESQLDALRAIATYAAAHPVRLILKLHPKESPRHQGTEPWFRTLTWDWLQADPAFTAARARLGDRLIVDHENTYDTYALIRDAAVCVTLTSQAGLEAAALDREVVLCGDAFFGGLGFTHDLAHATQLPPLLDALLAGERHLAAGPLARRFFHIFTELYCREKSEATLLDLLHGHPAPPSLPPSLPPSP